MIEFISEVRVINQEESRTVTFTLGDMIFEYDERKNEYNIEHHGISFKQAARVFLIMIELNCMMKRIVKLKIVMIQ